MATVTSLTAERMIAIEAASVIGGVIAGNNLILTKRDASTIDAGNVRGPQGIQGPIGEVSTAQLNAAIAAAIDLANPIGSIKDYLGIAAPNANWLAMIGQTVVNAETLYPDWWAILPVNMKSGSSAIMPDTRGRVSVCYDATQTEFDVLGEVGGAKTVVLTLAQIPAIPIDPPSLTVSVNPPNTTVTVVDPGHFPPLGDEYATNPGGSVSRYAVNPLAFDYPTAPSTYGTQPAPYPGLPRTYTGITASVDIAAFNVPVDIPSFNANAAGSGNPHSVLQPYVTFLKIIKVLK